jgi:hypothetical protein
LTGLSRLELLPHHPIGLAAARERQLVTGELRFEAEVVLADPKAAAQLVGRRLGLHGEHAPLELEFAAIALRAFAFELQLDAIPGKLAREGIDRLGWRGTERILSGVAQRVAAGLIPHRLLDRLGPRLGPRLGKGTDATPLAGLLEEGDRQHIALQRVGEPRLIIGRAHEQHARLELAQRVAAFGHHEHRLGDLHAIALDVLADSDPVAEDRVEALSVEGPPAEEQPE